MIIHKIIFPFKENVTTPETIGFSFTKFFIVIYFTLIFKYIFLYEGQSFKYYDICVIVIISTEKA